MPEQPQPREYFFLLTIATRAGTATVHGFTSLAPGTTRHQAFTALANQYFPQAMPTPTVLAFDLRPNQL
ncbi:hypothetical protein [Streptomyces sp. NBRC 110035]|uniref:hypothetical protein n=1 Tax=Streptomyces sp. NBRC 110035 TaxID=1547867 RepID=UPI0005AAAFCA|nr:hypothetical protein [Streptomyces sp. NBRC 110035]